MISGTDEHGTPNLVAAEEAGLSPGRFVDQTSAAIRRDLSDLGLSYDLFTRTTTQNHHRVVREVFRTLHAKGYLLKRSAVGAFAASSGRTLPDRYLEGVCPRCGFEGARGDQCDNCGNQLDPIDLIRPRSRIDGTVPVFRETEQFYLDLPAFSEVVAAWIRRSEHWRPNVRNFSLKLIDGLRPRAITRDLDWGIPVPVEGWNERDDKRIYVWFDAVIGYLSASIEWASASGDPDAWRTWWQDENARHYYFMGKDNIVFHTVIWPSILLGYGADGSLARGRRLKLPYDVVASEYLTMEGRKFSSSRAVAIYLNDFLSRYDPDPLRYYLAAAGPETQDTDFTWGDFVLRTNGELIANWGNLVHRTLTSAHRHFGAVPRPGELLQRDRDVLSVVAKAFDTVGGEVEAARFRAAVRAAMAASAAVNVYLAREQPWALVGTDRLRAATVLYVALRAINDLKTVFTPFLPFTCQLLHEQLGFDGWIAGPIHHEERLEDGASHCVLTGDYASWTGTWAPADLPIGQQLRRPQALFPKLDLEEVVRAELERMRVPG